MTVLDVIVSLPSATQLIVFLKDCEHVAVVGASALATLGFLVKMVRDAWKDF